MRLQLCFDLRVAVGGGETLGQGDFCESRHWILELRCILWKLLEYRCLEEVPLRVVEDHLLGNEVSHLDQLIGTEWIDLHLGVIELGESLFQLVEQFCCIDLLLVHHLVALFLGRLCQVSL